MSPSPGDSWEDPKRGKASLARLIPTALGLVVSVTLLLPILPRVKAQWFTDCEIGSSILDDDDGEQPCKANYAEAQKWNGIFDSLRSLIGFAVSAIVGRLSDAMGRRPILLWVTLCGMMPTLALLLTEGKSAPAYYTMSVLAGFSGVSFGGGSSVVIAYLADSYPPEERTRQFGLMGGIFGISMVISPLLSAAFSGVDHTIMFAICVGIHVLNILYIAFFLPESLPVDKRTPFVFSSMLNPLAPFKWVVKSNFIYWLALITFIASLPESGVQEIAIFFCDDVLDLHDRDAVEFNGILFACFGLSSMLSQTVLLSTLLKYKVSHLTILLLSQIMNIAHMLLYAILPFAPYKGVAYLNGLITGVFFLFQPAMNGMLANFVGPLEQGFASGTLASVRGLTGVLGPLIFSQAYSALGELKYIVFFVAAAFAVLCLILVQFPLRRAASESVVLPVGQEEQARALLQEQPPIPVDEEEVEAEGQGVDLGREVILRARRDSEEVLAEEITQPRL